MQRKRVIQSYKAPHQWVDDPPGMGDFIRGACYLFEKLQGSGIELRIDVSQTGFASLIEQDESIFQVGEACRVASAEEYFGEWAALDERLRIFLHSDDTELYVCTNVGACDRLVLPESTRGFIHKFYSFNEEVERMNAQVLQAAEYEVLHVRCGEHFLSNPKGVVANGIRQNIKSLIEKHVLRRAKLPVVVTSDYYEIKRDLAQRYGMLMLPHHPQPFVVANVLPEARDLCLLKNARCIYQINCTENWWSGFSHYTSIIFRIPSMKFRPPYFAKEEITAQGRLVTEWHWRVIRKCAHLLRRVTI